MSKTTVYNFRGEKVKDIKLSQNAFGVPSNNDLLYQVYVALDGNKRSVIAHTKGRGERKGSGRKPWKQKGTGNARTGSVRNPIWRKGGVTFGPTKDRNFKKKINKKMNQKAIAVALSEKVRSKSLIVVDEIKLANRKTKEFSQAFDSLKINGSTLVGFYGKEKDLRVAIRNLSNIDNILTNNLNVYDLLNHKNLVISVDSVKYLEEKYNK